MIIERPLYEHISIVGQSTAPAVVYTEGFEVDEGGWEVDPEAPVGEDYEFYAWRDDGNPRSGSYCLNLYRYDEDNPPYPAAAVRTFDSLEVGHEYTFSGWAKHTSGGSFGVLTASIGVDGIGKTTVVLPSAPNTWAEVSFTFTATSTSHLLRLEIDRTDEGNEAWGVWDDIALTRNTEDLVPDALGLLIRRGGVRDGLGVRTDVGLATFRLLDAQDPMDGGTLAPGQPVRILAGEHVPAYEVEHEEEVVYSQDFSSFEYGTEDPDGWTGSPTAAYVDLTEADDSLSLAVSRASSPTTGNVTASRTFSGLTVGRSYTFSAEVQSAASGTNSVKIVVTGVGESAPVNMPGSPSWPWVPISYTFTAEATSHTVVITGMLATGGFQSYYIDEVTLTQDAWTEVVPAVERQPIFTGRIAHLNSRYPLNKQTGQSRTYVEVTVADAVQIHGSTMRYGVDLGVDTDETFEERIDRLAASANAPVEVPEVGGPIVRYAL